MAREALSKKILMLGVDGMDPRFTLRMIREGKMPNLEKIIAKGSCREDLVMLGGHPTVTTCMWTTLGTGTNSNVHGITGFNRYSELGLDYIEYNLDSRNCHAEPLWNCFAEAGKKTLVWHWPGSSWPPTSDNPNLYVVDGSSPGSVGMSIGQFDSETILGANEDVKELKFLKGAGDNAVAPCAISGMEVADEDFNILGALKLKEIHRIIVDRYDGLINGDYSPIDIVQSPIRPAKGWINAPEDAKEFAILLSGGLIRRYGLILKNDAGIYDRVEMYKSKSDTQPLATFTVGELIPAISDEGIRNDERIACNRNMELIDLAEDGSDLRMYISCAMANDVSAIFHPTSLHDEVVEIAGHAPATSMLGNQNIELINHFMLKNWDYTMKWQAKAINGLIDREDFDVVFSHYHAVDLEAHMFIRYMTDKGYNKNNPKDYVKCLEDVYKQTDEYFGKFLYRLDEGWTLVLFSDHGQVCAQHDMVMMGDIQGINTGIMEELGLTRLKRDKDGNKLHEIDWEHTVAIAQRECHIYINLKGRDEHGIVDPKDKYEVEEEIMTRLYGYRDKKTGKRVISIALRNRDAVLLGEGGPDSGDIIYWLAEGYNFDHADCISTTLGMEETSVSPFFVAAGPGFKENFKTDRIIRQVDFAPTIAWIGGVRMPAQCEGAPVYQIFDQEF